MLSPTLNQLHRLQGAAAYHTLRSQLRSAGLPMVGVGGLLCGLTFLSLSYLFAFLPLLLFGLWLISYGLTIIKWEVLPRPSIFDQTLIGIVVMTIGILLYETVVFSPAAGHIARSTIALPIQLIVWFLFPWRYKRALQRMPTRPAANDMQWIEQIVQELRRSSAKTKLDIIEFVLHHQRTTYPYKGHLYPEIGIFIDEHGSEVSVMAKRDVRITPQPPSTHQKGNIPVSFQLRDQTVIGTISADSLAHYEQWKGSP